jgi:hypothetical protein
LELVNTEHGREALINKFFGDNFIVVFLIKKTYKLFQIQLSKG